MATYLILNCCMLIMICIVLRRHLRRPGKAWAYMFGILLVSTALFDSLMIQAGLFSYATDKILGIYIGRAPIEDFFYAFAAAILIPAVWHKTGGDKDTDADKN